MVAVVSLKGKASTHLVSKSVVTRIYLLPCKDVGRGPIMSHDFSKGHAGIIVPSGAPGFCSRGLCF